MAKGNRKPRKYGEGLTSSMTTKLKLVDEYFHNGFSKVNAVRSVLGKDIDTMQASNAMDNVLATMADEVKERQLTAQQAAGITNKDLLLELVTMMRADVRDYVGLDEDGIKALPASKARCIQKITIKSTEQTIDGVTIKNTTTDIQLVDRLGTVKEIGKHIGFYEKDNQQRRKVINVDKLNIENINAILNAMPE